MNKYLDLLFKAIGKVDADYFFTEDIYSHIQYNERVFCYELYHVLRLIDSNLLSNCKINGEITKRFELIQPDTYGIKTDTNFEEEKKYKMTPDMVIHQSQGNTEGQYLILEVKNSKNRVTSIDWDLYKLLVYTEKLEFEIGVYLQVNGEMDKIIESIKGKKGIPKDKDELFKKITIIGVTLDSDNKTKIIKYCTLYDVIKKEKSKNGNLYRIYQNRDSM